MITIHPAFAQNHLHGQVPGLDELQQLTTPSTQYMTYEAPTQLISHVAGDLGLPRAVSDRVHGVVRSEMAAAANELDFRRGLMSHMLDQRFEPELRRAVLSRALSYYRAHKRATTSTPAPRLVVGPRERQLQREESLTRGAPARGGRYHRRIPRAGGGYTYVYDEAGYNARSDAHVHGPEAKRARLHDETKRLLDRSRGAGLRTQDLAHLVRQHGSDSVATALRAHGAVRVDREAGRVHVSRPDWSSVAKSFGAPGPAPGSLGQPSSKKLPAGSRRIWHNRIVEKLPDNKWHVVGHVAGLEDPSKKPADMSSLPHPQLGLHEIDPAQLRDLIAKIRAIKDKIPDKTHEEPHVTSALAPPPKPEPGTPTKTATDSKTETKTGTESGPKVASGSHFPKPPTPATRG